jgi:GTP-binding protein HflX
MAATERAVLAVIHGPGDWSVDDDLSELADLARSAGAEVVGVVTQRHGRYHPATLFGEGKVAELREVMVAQAAHLALCNRDLSPRQQMRLEEAVDARVVDRTRLILDVFARRARSREGRIQVELAQCLYLLPRLGSLVEEMGRTGGGIGTRGPGETQLESDRRRVRRRIAALQAQLQAVAATRQVQRQGRSGLPRVALVGYTNAGKSTLHRALTGSDVLAADVLFATLDPTTRLLALPQQRRALLSDTVGFIHDLPHHLVAAFAATLEEVSTADLLLEVVDASHPRAAEQRAAVERVLTEIGAAELPRIVVWNKMDLVPHDTAVAALPAGADDHPLQVRVSAATGEGLEALRRAVAERLPLERVEVRVRLALGAEALVAAARREGEILELRYGAEGIDLVARSSPALAARLEAAAIPPTRSGTTPTP